MIKVYPAFGNRFAVIKVKTDFRYRVPMLNVYPSVYGNPEFGHRVTV